MALTEREHQVLITIQEWEKKLYYCEPNDFQLLYDKYIERTFQLLPASAREQILSSLDHWLFYLHSFIQNSEFQLDSKERILSSGRIFDESIKTIEDMKVLTIDQLKHIADQHIVRHRFFSLTQGGLSGTGKGLFLGADIPAIAVINLRAIQQIAITYGVEVNTPFEMINALKVLTASLLPLRMQGQIWSELVNDVPQANQPYIYEGDDNIATISWLEQLLNQIIKAIVIILVKKKTIQGVPFIGMTIGAVSNYKLTKKVTDFSHKYYQMRYLLQKEI